MKSSIIICILSIFIACESPNNSESEIEWPNHPPVIKDIVAYPGTTSVGHEFILICVAEDEDGDSLSYFWDFMNGSSSHLDDNMAIWSVDTIGSYSVSCEVSDGQASDELTVTLNVF